ncbi:MAG: hypothetical protein KBC36_07025 [Spirochaetia bacterium]|nr:hypothetical protein [Spirochaetia bacterium]
MTHRNDGKGTGKGQLGRPRRGSAAFAVLTLVLASLPCRTDPAGAQALPRTGSRAVLVRSDPAGKGLPFLPLPNAFPAHAAEYRAARAESAGAASDPEPVLPRAWYSRAPVFLGPEWRSAACGAAFVPGARALEYRSGNGTILTALEYPGYRVFIETPDDWPDRCRFAAALAERIAYFLRYAPDPVGFSMPAIVDF